MTKTLLIPIPSQDFDPSEVALMWQAMQGSEAVKVQFASPQGSAATADPEMLTGRQMGPIVGQLLKAKPAARKAYAQMIQSPEFMRPFRWADLQVDHFDALHLPGGHAPGMREYLESEQLQKFVQQFAASGKPISIVCHGIILAARSGILKGKKVTALPWFMENFAYRMSNSFLSRTPMKHYYLTYPELPVQTETEQAVGADGGVETGPSLFASQFQTFVVRDGNLITARWPGDMPALVAALKQDLANL